MRKKLTILFALLCASVMGWAGVAQGTWIPTTAPSTTVYTEQFKWYAIPGENTEGLSVNEIQEISGQVVIYVNFQDAGFTTVEGCERLDNDGSLAFLKVSSLVNQENTNVYIKNGDVVRWAFRIHNAKYNSGSGSSTKESECFGTKGHYATPSVKNVYYQIEYADNKAVISLRSLTGHNLDYAEVQIMSVVNSPMTADGNGGYTYTINNPTVNAEWYIRFLYRDTNMPGNEMTALNLSTTDANIIYYKVGECTYSTIEDSNMALSSLGTSATGTDAESNTPDKAIDGDNSTRWSSEWDVDPQDFVLDLGQRRKFNAIQFVWYTTYSRTFDLLISDNGKDWTKIKSVDRELQNADYKEESFDLGFNYTAQYIKFHGITRGEGYGHSFREIRVLYSTTPVLTTYSASLPSRFATIGSDYQIQIVAKDQLGNDFPVSSTYSIEPAAAGTITTDGVYTPAQTGTAIITAQGGGKFSSFEVRNEISANLALNKTAIAGQNNSEAYKSNNENLTDRWYSGGEGAVHYAGGANPDFKDWWYVDLGKQYDITEIAVKWEGACPNDYDIRISPTAEAESWVNLQTYDHYPSATQNDGNASYTNNYEYYHNFANPQPGRYVGFWARNGFADLAYGISMYDVQVFGQEHVEAGVDVTGITLDETAATVEIGESLTLTATVSPYNATIKTITWKSSDETVATVVDGVITTLKDGTADITATANDGSGVFATCALTVEPITAKTWWGTQTITYWDPDMDVMWSVTRNANKTLTYTVYFGGDASGKVKQINNGGWHNLVGYDDVNRVASYTTETKYEKGTKIKPDHFFFFGGPRIELADVYVVGSENERPSTAVESVEISSTAASLLPEENLQLTATVLPSFVENKNVIWSSDNTNVATVSNTGYVTAVAEGTAHITATSVADGTKSATCTVKVVGSITSATWYGYSTVSPQEGLTAYTYSITRGTDHKLTFKMTTDKNVVGYVSGIEGDVTGAFGGYDAEHHTGTFTTAGTYTDGAVLHLRLTFASASYGAPEYNFSYTVGDENDPLPQAVAVDEKKDNNAILTTYNGQTVIGVLGRSFTTGNLYTLVLPFDVDAAQTAEKLPGQLTKLNNSYLKENGDLRLNFVNASAVEAGVPYLYQPSADVINPAFVGVSVSKDINPTKPADGYAQYYGIYAPMDGDALHAKTNAYVLGPDQYLYAVADLPDTQTMKALRAYFVLNFPSAAPGAPKRLAKVVFNENETETTTDIEDLQTDIECTKVIVNGQLQIIRDGKTYNAFGQLVK